MAGQFGTQAVGAQFATDKDGAANGILSLDHVIQSRAASLSGMSKQMSYWSDSFMNAPGYNLSIWSQMNVANVAMINNVPGGVAQVFSNAGTGRIMIDPFADFPFSTNPTSWIGELDANDPIYLFVRFRIPSVPGGGGPGGWDTSHCSGVIGFVDSETLAVAGVGIAFSKTKFGAVGGDITNPTNTVGVDTQVTIDFDVWHDMEFFTRLGKYWVKIDDREAVDCSAIFPGTMSHGMPFVQVQTDDVLQPAFDIDHIAFACPPNRADIASNPAHPYP